MSFIKIKKIIGVGCISYLMISLIQASGGPVPPTKSSLFFHKKQIPSPETVERHLILREQPLAYRPFIDPLFSFQVGSSDASQVSPMSLTAYWRDPSALYAHTGGNREARLKGMLKLLLLVEAQYVQKVPVYRLTESERQKILQESFYNFLNKGNKKINYGVGRQFKSGVQKFFNTKGYRDSEELKQQQFLSFEQATAQQIIHVFKSVMESLVIEFMNRPLLSLEERGYVFGYRAVMTPSFIVSRAKNQLNIFDPNPLKQSSRAKSARLREVAIALNFVAAYLKNPSMKDKLKKNYVGRVANQMFSETYKEDPQNMPDAELREIIVKIGKELMKITALDKFTHVVETSSLSD